jgi:molybdopterin-containing oxidoreductase family iron-sulfur binding subunit
MANENDPSAATGLTRRDFVRTAGLVTAGVAVAVSGTAIARILPKGSDVKGEDSRRTLPGIPTTGGAEDCLVRMQRELIAAMAKPMEERHWGMVIDTRKCVGCHACTVACIAENNLPPGVVYRPVITEESGTEARPGLRFIPRPCMQCDNPTCVSVCPVNATWKRADGVVAIDYDSCIGCRYCLTACPYGARTSDFGHEYSEGTPAAQPYESVPCHEYGKRWSRANHGSPVGNARKCHFCLHRLEKGLLPECVTTCVGRANYFGDLNDPRSLVAEKAALPNKIRLLEEKGTKPVVIHLI